MASNPSTLYKQQLAKSFGRAAVTYDQHADFQHQVLASLISMLPKSSFRRTADLGCGTGNALPALITMSDELMALDLSVEMLNVAREKTPNATFICADAEHLPFPSDSVDLFFSSLAIQWTTSHFSLFKEINRALEKGGYWCFSTLCDGSMQEIADSWEKVDGRLHSNQYPHFEEILANLVPSGFVIEDQKCTVITMHFDSVQSAVYSVKKVGASVITDSAHKSYVTPSIWREFVGSYHALHDGIGIPLSYSVAYVVARKV
jgi:malonyl-CoA O-methyltransferase